MAKVIAAKPQLVQVSTAYGTQKEGSPVLPRNKYTAIRDDKPKSKDEATRPEFKACKYTTEAIITEGSDVGTIHKVCANPECVVHHPKAPVRSGTNDAQWKAEQEKRRKEEAIANATGMRVLSAIAAAVPVRLTKRDLLFVAERLAGLLDENRLAVIARQHGIKKAKDNESIGKLFLAFLRRAEESTLGRAVVESVILLSASRGNASQVLRDAAAAYKVDTDVRLENIDKLALQTHLNRMAKTRSRDSVLQAVAYVRAIFREAVEQDFLLKDPARTVKPPSELKETDKTTLTWD